MAVPAHEAPGGPVTNAWHRTLRWTCGVLILPSVALAGAPDTVDLEDTDAWVTAADQLLDGPPGCWEVVGTASWNHDYARFGASRGDALFAGRLVDGIWGTLHIEPLGEVVRKGRDPEHLVYRSQPTFVPLIGRLGEDFRASSSDEQGGEVAVEVETDEPTNVLRSVLEDLSGETSFTYVEWHEDKDAVELHKVAPMGRRAGSKEVELTVTFPGGTLVPAQADVQFPDAFGVNAVPRVSIRDAQVHLRGRVHAGQVFPTAETFHFGMRVLGFRFSSSQTIRYTQMRRCVEG